MEALEALFAGPWGPLAIFALRIVDVSLSTIRIVLAVRGHKYVVPFIGFFEVLIWVFAVGHAIRFLDSPLHLLGYAGGFATGSIVGLLIEERLAIGYASIRVVSRHAGVEMADALRSRGFGVTAGTVASRSCIRCVAGVTSRRYWRKSRSGIVRPSSPSRSHAPSGGAGCRPRSVR
jgi:uncharacterized protein YebE (UPF0316 family)